MGTALDGHSWDISAGNLSSHTFSTRKIENISIKFKSAKIKLVQVAILVSPDTTSS